MIGNELMLGSELLNEFFFKLFKRKEWRSKYVHLKPTAANSSSNVNLLKYRSRSIPTL